MDWTD